MTGSVRVFVSSTNVVQVDFGDGQSARVLGGGGQAFGGGWDVPVGIEAILVGGTSNYVGGLTLFDGSRVFVDVSGIVTVWRPDTVDRENNLLLWGSAGLVCGVFVGCLSLVGYVFKKFLDSHFTCLQELWAWVKSKVLGTEYDSPTGRTEELVTWMEEAHHITDIWNFSHMLSDPKYTNKVIDLHTRALALDMKFAVTKRQPPLCIVS